MNDVSELYKKSTLVTPTEVQTYVSALENNKTIICNNNHNYIFATKLFSTSEIYTILDKKNVEEKTKKKELPVCLCNGFYDSMTLLELQPNEETLYHILTTKFWPGLLHICVRAKSFVDSLVTYNDTHIILGSPSHRQISSSWRPLGLCPYQPSSLCPSPPASPPFSRLSSSPSPWPPRPWPPPSRPAYPHSFGRF